MCGQQPKQLEHGDICGNQSPSGPFPVLVWQMRKRHLRLMVRPPLPPMLAWLQSLNVVCWKHLIWKELFCATASSTDLALGLLLMVMLPIRYDSSNSRSWAMVKGFGHGCTLRMRRSPPYQQQSEATLAFISSRIISP